MKVFFPSSVRRHRDIIVVTFGRPVGQLAEGHLCYNTPSVGGSKSKRDED
jgi:hypothetical protein